MRNNKYIIIFALAACPLGCDEKTAQDIADRFKEDVEGSTKLVNETYHATTKYINEKIENEVELRVRKRLEEEVDKRVEDELDKLREEVRKQVLEELLEEAGRE